jgi:hypothetical protein
LTYLVLGRPSACRCPSWHKHVTQMFKNDLTPLVPPKDVNWETFGKWKSLRKLEFQGLTLPDLKFLDAVS